MGLLWDVAGWTGTAAILTGYLAVSMNWINAGRGFQTVNLLSACGLTVNGIYHEAWPSVATNTGWLLISVIALVRLRSGNRPKGYSIDPQQVQFPGVPDTGQLAVVIKGNLAPRVGTEGGKINEQ